MQKAIPQTQAMNAGCNVVVVSRRSDIHMSELTALIDKVERFTETFNWPLFGVVLTLLAIGLVNLYSAVSFWEETNAVSLFWNQMAWVGVGLLVMVAAIFFDYRVFKSLAITIYVLVLLLLMISIFFGSTVRGTHGWIQLGPFNLQPAELAKIAYILIAAKYFSDHPNPDGCGLLDLWQPFLFMFIPVALIIYQGDLGSSLFLICIFEILTDSHERDTI